MKILLVNPTVPAKFKILDYANEKEIKAILKREVGPPFGLNELAGALPEEEFSILDQKTLLEKDENYDPVEGLIEVLKGFDPDIVGFTCLTTQYNSLKNVLAVVKKYNKNILTVVGGLHATACPDHFVNYDVDLLVLGIGKTTFCRLVREFKKQRCSASFTHIPGLAVKTGNSFYYTKSLHELSRKQILDEHYRRDLLPNRQLTEKYNYIFPKLNRKITYLSTTLGCTDKCNFCYLWEMTGGRFLARSADSIITELKTLDQYPIIRFCDVHTFGDINMAKELFTRILEEGLDQHIYLADVRTDTVMKYPEVFQLAGNAGLRVVVCGLEATSDAELQHNCKNNTIANTKNAIRVLNESKIYVNGNYIIRPDYEEKDFERVARFIDENPIWRSEFSILTPFPGTYQWEELKNQIVIHDLDYYNLINAVLKTKLPEETFYNKVAGLYSLSLKATEKFFEKYGMTLAM